MSRVARRVAVVGDSHVGAIRNAWRVAATSYPDVQLTFFAAPGAGLAELHIVGDALVASSAEVRASLARTSGQDGGFVPSAFDEIVIVALGVSSWRARAIRRQHRYIGMEDVAGAPFLVSRAAFRVALRDALANTTALNVVRLVRSLQPGARVRLVPQPHPRKPPEPLPDHSKFTVADAAALNRLYEEVLDEVCVAHALPLLAQPAHTLDGHLWTAPRYGGNAADVNGGPAPAGDLEHMGASYGEEVLRQLFATTVAGIAAT